jgi:hypothetical protein
VNAIKTRRSRADVAALVLALCLAWPCALFAHDIPNDLTVHAVLKPDGDRLRLLVRVPLQAMRDIDYPRRGREFVDLGRVDQALREAALTWLAHDIEVYEGSQRLADPQLIEVRASLPSDDSFRSYETAMAHVTGPRLPADMEFVWTQGLLDVLFEYPIASDHSEFSIDPRWGRLGVRTVTGLRFLPSGGPERMFEFVGDPGLVRLDPRWHQAALRFVRLGFFHILDGTDHLLFLVCLVIPFRRLRALVVLVTSFTIAHSATLLASAYDFVPSVLWFPPLIETLIAMSIVYMALENIVAPDLRRRWMVTFGFGLVHGFGFSFALRQMLQFAGSHLVTSLLSFNLGVELGQLLVLVILIPILQLVFTWIVAERPGTIIVSVFVAHTAWHWLTERADRLRQYSFQPPALTAATWLAAVRWITVVVAFATIAWLIVTMWRRRQDVIG